MRVRWGSWIISGGARERLCAKELEALVLGIYIRDSL
jgi:hypothetical protein